MKKFIFILAVPALIVSCRKPIPPEKEIREKLTGVYCGDGVKLVINDDSTFTSYKELAFGGTAGLSLHCNGKYTLTKDEKTGNWKASFKGKQSAMMKCGMEFLIWDRKFGFKTDTLREIISGGTVVKGNCK